MELITESKTGLTVILKIDNKEFALSRHAYNQILNNIWTVKSKNNELIIYDENLDEIDRF